MLFLQEKTYYFRFNVLKVLSLGIFLLPTLTLFSQNQELINELSNKLGNTSDEKTKVDIYESLAWEYKLYDTEKTRFLARKGLSLALAQKPTYTVGAANCYNRIGNSFEFEGVYDSALVTYFAALGLDSLQENTYPKGRDYHMIAVVYRKKGDYEQAIAHELKSIVALKSPPETEKKALSLALVYNSLGNAYREIGSYSLGIDYFQQGLLIQEKRNDYKGISKTYNEIGLAYEAMAQKQSALIYYQKSLNISQKIHNVPGEVLSYFNIGNVYYRQRELDSALVMYQKSLNLSRSLSDKMMTQDVIHAIGVVYGEKGEYDLALIRLEESLTIREAAGEESKMAESYACIAHIMTKQGKQEEGLRSYNKALSLAQAIKNPHLEVQALDGIVDTYSEMEDYGQAYVHYQLSARIKDSLHIEERLATDIDIVRKEKKVLKMELANANLRSEKSKQLLYSVILGSILLLIAGFASILSIRHKQKARIAFQETTIAQKEVTISRNEIDNLLKTQELKLMNAMLEGQDEERNRIAADLHDRLGGILSMVRLHFKSVEKSIRELETQNLAQYNVANDLLIKACDTVREISHDIGDSLLLKVGLVPALEDMASTIELSKELEVSVVHQGITERLPNKIEINLFKIIQELFSNILKHAEAETVELSLFLNKGTLSVTVEDDGKGFDKKAAEARDGMGMLNIKSRLEELNGTFDLDSQIDHGTTITLEIPCPSL